MCHRTLVRALHRLKGYIVKIRKVNAKHHNLFTKSLNKMRFNAELPKAIGKPVLYDANIAEKVTQTAKESIRKFYNKLH